MLKRSWMKWTILLAGGLVVLQTPACVETATTVTAVSSVVTATGVLYLVGRILE